MHEHSENGNGLSEAESLPMHVALCHERYSNLNFLAEKIDRRVWRIEVWGVVALCAIIVELLTVIYLLWPENN